MARQNCLGVSNGFFLGVALLYFMFQDLSNCCRKGDPFQGPKVGSCLALRNELSEETHVLTKQEILLGRGTRWRAVGWGNPGGLLYHVAYRFYGDKISFPVVFSQSF